MPVKVKKLTGSRVKSRVSSAALAAKRARANEAALPNDGESSKSVEEQQEGGLPMGKYLASTDKKIRDGAVRSIADFLSRSEAEPLSALEMQKLWKGIFYCFWMSDKPLVQQALAQELADLVLLIHAAPGEGPGRPSKKARKSASDEATASRIEPALSFLEGFFDAMTREWHGLDKWRVPKFYLLIRRFLNAAFRLLAREGWPSHATQRLDAMLTKQGGALCPNDVKVPSGVTYHICDIYMDELGKVATRAQAERNDSHRIPVASLLQPFVDLCAKTSTALVYDRVMSAVLDPWLDALIDAQLKALHETSQDAHEEGQSTGLLAIVAGSIDGTGKGDTETAIMALRKTLFAALFKAASQSDANEARRRKIYQLCKTEQERVEEEEE